MLKEAIFISGAAQRVGYGLAERFLTQTEYPVIFSYRTEHEAVAALKAKGAIGIQVDFSEPLQVASLISTLQAQTESLRAVIHNASLWVKDRDLELTSEKDVSYQALFEVHMAVPFQLTHALAPLLLNSNSPTSDVIALSDCAVENGRADYAAYLSTKAGLESLMRSLAHQWAPKIKANTIAPGLVLFHEQDSQEYRQARLAKMANPKPIGVEAIWAAVRFIMASEHVSGERIALGNLPSREKTG